MSKKMPNNSARFDLSVPGNLPQRIIDRFFARLSPVVTEKGCIEWTGNLNDAGYGVIQDEQEGKAAFYRAHRVAIYLRDGSIPNDREACHKCHNRKCVNADHLYVGTHKQNMNESYYQGRIPKPPDLTGEKHHQAILTEKEVKRIRKMRKAGMKVTEIAPHFPQVSVFSLYDVCSGKSWSHLPL